MDELLNTITEAESMHESCRVWITTEVHPKFPISLLQVNENYNKQSLLIIHVMFVDEHQIHE